FFQAEDGIRDGHVTGVQTCALPISQGRLVHERLDVDDDVAPRQGAVHGFLDGVGRRVALADRGPGWDADHDVRELPPRGLPHSRSEERRVGKECRCTWSAYTEEKTR